MKKGELKNFIFDFDGTIVDSQDLMINIAIDISKELKLKVSQKDLLDIEKFRNMSPKEIIKYFNLKWYQFPKIIKLSFEKYDKKIISTPLVTGMDLVIKTLEQKQKFVGILSTNSLINIKKILKRENLNKIDDISCSKGMYFMKNTMLEQFIKKHGLKKIETIYIGDEVRDIEAAKKVHITSGAVLWGLNNKEIIQKYSPDMIFEKPEDILKI